MQNQRAFIDLEAGPAALPRIRHIGVADLKDALAQGLDDFWAMPSHAVFVTLIYPVLGLFLTRLVLGYEVLPLLFPLIAGFALIGPFAATGMYELSRLREQGAEPRWKDAFQVLHSPSFRSILALGALLMGIFVCWMYAAETIYLMTFGDALPLSMSGFIHDVFRTEAGWQLIIIGNGVGFLFAVAALLVSTISFPLLVDRNIGAAAAMATSIRAVLANPLVMALWGLIVAVALALGAALCLMGLAVVMPVLGHATWHLYRKVVDR
jgi:uncharacterized membrane protein